MTAESATILSGGNIIDGTGAAAKLGKVVLRGDTIVSVGPKRANAPIDLNRAHATNPEWPRHARFHLVWQVSSSALLCAVAVGLIWLRRPITEYNFYLAAVLTCIPLIGFLTALVSRKMYGGALSDPNGIPPVRLSIRGLVLYLDMNLVAVLVAFAALTAILVIYR